MPGAPGKAGTPPSPAPGPACPACGAPSTTPALLQPAIPLQLHRCTACKTVFQAETSGFDPELYDYYGERLGQPRAVLHPRANEAGMKRTLASLASLVPGRRLLDVGCGQGQFVAVALSSGWQATGIDLSETAIQVCRSLGLPCQKASLFDPALPAAGFDAITMVELIEHVSDPGAILERAEALLAPGGVLLLTTPNWSSASRRLLGPAWRAIHREHIFYFSPRTLRRLVRRRTGLEILRLRTSGTSAAALRACLRLRRPPPTLPTANPDAGETQALRAALAGSRAGKGLRAAGNLVLGALQAGDTIKMVCRRRGTEG